MADHRLRSQFGAGAGVGAGAAAGTPITAGILFGAQVGQRVEIFNSSEMALAIGPDGSVLVDEAFVRQQKDLSECAGANPS